MQRLLNYGLIIAVIVILDLLKFLVFGSPTLVNWQSPAHYLWVSATLMFFLGWSLLGWLRLGRALFWLHAAVAIAALINHYLPFADVLTYNCMLFNFAFASVYFAAGDRNFCLPAGETQNVSK